MLRRSTTMWRGDWRCLNIIFRLARRSSFGFERIKKRCARTPLCVTGTRLSRSNSCPCSKQNHSDGKRWPFLILVPLIRINHWRATLPSGGLFARQIFVRLWSESRPSLR